MRSRIVLGVAGLAGLTVAVCQMSAVARPEAARSAAGHALGRTPAPPPTQEGTLVVDIAVSRVGLVDVGSADDFAYFGVANGIRAFSSATTACNVGTNVAQWIDGSSGNHPLIAQNLYRHHSGRFEQIGLSWLKHSFCAVNELTCGICQDTPCSTLGLGCADTYTANRNGTPSTLGPRYQINPQGFGSGGTHTDGHPTPSGSGSIAGRLQVANGDIIGGAQYALEIHYVTHDELGENRNNNASWRPVNVTTTSMSGIGSGQASVRFQQVGLSAWKEFNPAVTLTPVEVPGEGRFHIAYLITDNGDGTHHYEYAVHNMNSDRAGQAFSVPVPDGVTLTNVGFHDVGYHSGETQVGTDWTFAHTGGAATWQTETQAQNANANKLSWGTTYNFRFDANSTPQGVPATITLWKPGTPGSVAVDVMGPIDVPPGECVTDFDGDNSTGFADLSELLGNWGPCPGCFGDFDGDNVVGFVNLSMLLEDWGPCP